MRWSLKEIYPSFESIEFQNDLAKIDEFIVELNDLACKIDGNKDSFSDIDNQNYLVSFIKLSIKFNEIVHRLYEFASLTNSVNVKDTESTRYMQILDNKIIKTTKSKVILEKWIGGLNNLNELIDEVHFLHEFKFYLLEIAKSANHLLSNDLEEFYAKMAQTGSTAWVRLQSDAISSLMVDIEEDGKLVQHPLPVVRNLAYDKDAKLRKKGYEAELKAYKKVDNIIGAALNSIKGEVITVSEQRGYKSPLDMTLEESRMDKQTLDSMLIAIKEALPEFHKYLRRKGELLGHKNGLPFYDLLAPMGEVNMEFSYDEARDFVIDNYAKFSKKLADFATNAFANHWIDAEPRQGKRGGGFCASIHSIGESRILTNFTGTFSDVSTLAHELGHAYHAEVLKEASILNSDYPMPLAETASIFCETIVSNAVKESANKKELFTLLESSISDATQVIVDIYSRYLFESMFFEKRKDCDLTVDEINETMLSAQKEAYGFGLDQDTLHPYMWACKPHYYYVDANFYNFPYAFGQLFALGLYSEYKKRGESFLDDYDKLLYATGDNNITEVAKLMDIDVNSVDFWRSSLKVITDQINEFIRLSN